VALESTRTIEIDEFVDRSEIDPRYLIRPYYLRPDGKVGHDAFAVIRETIREMNKVAIGVTNGNGDADHWQETGKGSGDEEAGGQIAAEVGVETNRTGRPATASSAARLNGLRPRWADIPGRCLLSNQALRRAQPRRPVPRYPVPDLGGRCRRRARELRIGRSCIQP
jgi:hypothetical protein